MGVRGKKEVTIVSHVDALIARMEEVRAAQREFASFTQEQVDKIFFAAAMAANKAQGFRLQKWPWKRPGWGSWRIR